jgi:PAS domain S-box-containing protein
MWIYDLENLKFLAVNDSASLKYGYTKDEFYNMTIKEIRPQADINLLLNDVRTKFDPFQWSGSWKHVLKNGTIIDVEILSHEIIFNNRKARLVTVNDVTEKKRAEKEIILAKEKAEEMNRLKSNFLTAMSHELRTPMVGILGAIDLFKNSESLEEVRELSDLFEESAKRLLRTLNEILDISKIEADKVDVHMKEISVEEVIEKTTAIFKIEAEKKNLYFNLIIKERGITVYLDEDVFVHILNNLLNNAIKFTNTGGITVKVSKNLIESRNYLEIAVQDTGCGILEEKYDIIFEAFRQASEGYTRIHEGTGLGLTLAKKYTEMMNGKISVKSEIGKGSIFFLHFPILKDETVPVEKVLEA